MTYWKYRIADWLLCTCISVSLVFTVCSGFVLEDAWSSNVLVVVLLSLLLQAILVLLSYNRATMGLGILAGAALAVLAIAYIQAFHPMVDETANSLFLYILIEILVSLLVYLLARTRIGLGVLFLVGTIVTAGAHFLQFPASMWSALLLPVGAGMLFLYRTYLGAVRQALLGKIRNVRYILQSVILIALAFCIAGGLYLGVVRPLNPPTQELKLITALKSMELTARLGVSSVKNVLDPTLSAETPPDMTEYDEAQDQPPETQDDSEPEPEEDLSPQTEPESAPPDATPISYDEHHFNPLWLLLLIPAAVIAACVGRILWKRRWRRKVLGLGASAAVVNYYRYFLSRLGRVGLKRDQYRTLREFVSQEEQQLEPYAVEGTTFGDLTGVYERVIYSHGPVTDEELNFFNRFYDRFLYNLRHEYGTAKYYLLLFRF